MQIDINELTLTDIFKLSQLVKEKFRRLSSLEEVASALMHTFYRSFIAEDGKNVFVLSRFFKSSRYEDLPNDIKKFIQHSEGRENVPEQNEYLTLLGSSGDMEEWNCRKGSKGHQALPLYDPGIIENIPMLSSLLSQIGFKISTTATSDKNTIIDKEEREYGIFCVEEARESNFIPKQAEFIEPFGIKSVFGFGGSYNTGQIYAIIIFCREKITTQKAKLFLSLNPSVKMITLGHEMKGSIFKVENSSA